MILNDSLGKYVNVPRAVVKAFPSETVTKLRDRIRSSQVDIAWHERILVHVGTNNVADLLSSRRARSVTPQQVLRKYKVLREVIRRQNSRALILFSYILLRLNQLRKFKPYVLGLNYPWRNVVPSNESPVYLFHCKGASWQAESQGKNCSLRMDFT